MDNSTLMISFIDSESLEDFNARYAESLIPVTVLLVVFVIIGVPGNLLVLGIFSKKYSNTNFRTSVLSLAIVDLITCASLIPLEIMKSRSYFMFPFPVKCKLKCFFDMFSRSATSLLLIFICIDRHRKVCRPLKRQISPSMTLKIVVVLIFVSFILAVPALIMCGIAPINVLDKYGGNITIQHCSAEAKYIKSIFRIIYKYFMSLLLVIIVVSLVVLYSLTLRTIINQTKSLAKFSFSGSSGSHANASTEIVDLGPDNQQQSQEMQPVSPRDPNQNKDRKVSNAGSTKFSFSANSKRPSAKRSLSTSSSVSVSSRRRLSSVVGKRARPYKTLIWFVLTIIFLVTNILYAVLSFWSAKHYRLSPSHLAGFVTGYRLYYINNIVNPIVYACIDRVFQKSCKEIVSCGKA